MAADPPAMTEHVAFDLCGDANAKACGGTPSTAADDWKWRRESDWVSKGAARPVIKERQCVCAEMEANNERPR